VPLPRRDDRVLLAPLGGVGVIGMNNMLIGYGEDLVLLDCGVLFADERQPGADLVLPSLSLLDRLADRLRAIVLTHGHEDHIGAVPYVASRLKLPVYGTKFTLALLAEKAKGRGIGTLDLREIAPGAKLTIGKLNFEFLRVTHSIPDCVSLAIRTPIGNVLFTGDWKRDDGLPCGTKFDIEGFRRFGDEGVLAMLSDSTNAEVPGFSRSEADVAEGLRDAISTFSGRVLIGLFASNLYRIHGVIEAARANGRKVALSGRSIFRYLDACRAWGGLRIDESMIIDAKHLDRYEDHEVCVVCTGSQGEPRATLARVAAGTHPYIRARKGDTLMLSARKIPGNDRAIYSMIDGFCRKGVEVIHRDDRWPIHASGHAASGELDWLIEAVRPTFFMPVHGVYPFLLKHAAIAREQGAEVPVMITNGDVIELGPDGPVKVGEFEAEPWLVDNDRAGTAASLGVDQRYDLAWNGTVAVSVDMTTDEPDVRVSSRGLWTDRGRLLDVLADELTPWLTRMSKQGMSDDALEEETAGYVKRYFRRAVDRRPLVMAHLHRAEVYE
jgi:ribonuclease J